MHNHPLAYIDPDGQFAWLLVPLALGIAADLCLPAAVAFIEPYAGVMAGSFLTGLAKGYTCDYSLGGAMEPGSQMLQGIGMMVGTALNLNPKGVIKGGVNVTRAAGNALVNFAAKESVQVAANLAGQESYSNCALVKIKFPYPTDAKDYSFSRDLLIAGRID